MTTATAIFAGGCFWGTEAGFRKFLSEGVLDVESGYTGGSLPNPTYEQVCSGTTGHKEAVKVTYDSDKLSYARLLDLFFQMHDPFQYNGQGNDIGTEYQSAIYYSDEHQQEEAQKKINEVKQKAGRELATALIPEKPFYRAEEYHQRYLEKNKGGYCHVNLEALK